MPQRKARAMGTRITLLVTLWWLSLLGMSCVLPTTTYTVEDWVQPYWAEAQSRLVGAGHENAVTIHPSRFLFISHQPDCKVVGYTQPELGCINGHFVSPYGQIHYSVAIKRVVIHEAGHAILWALGKPDSVWRNWEH